MKNIRTTLDALGLVLTLLIALAGCGGGGPSTASSPDGDFSIVFPTKFTAYGKAGEVLISFSAHNDHEDYSVSRVFHNFASATDTINLQQESDSVISMWTPTIRSDETTEFKGRQARYIEFTGNDPSDGRQISGTARFYVDGPLFYEVFAVGDGDVAAYQAFVESFDFLTEPGAVLHG